MIMEDAYYDGKIPKNPFVRLKAPESQVKIEYYRDAYTDEELALIFEKAKETAERIHNFAKKIEKSIASWVFGPLF